MRFPAIRRGSAVLGLLSIFPVPCPGPDPARSAAGRVRRDGREERHDPGAATASGWRPTSTGRRGTASRSPGGSRRCLTRTPYDKGGAAGEGKYYAERGYVVVANDMRGRYASEGTWH